LSDVKRAVRAAGNARRDSFDRRRADRRRIGYRRKHRERLDRSVGSDTEQRVRPGIGDQTLTRIGQNAVRVRIDRASGRVLVEFVKGDVGVDFPLPVNVMT
jgi:hypothetical protein